MKEKINLKQLIQEELKLLKEDTVHYYSAGKDLEKLAGSSNPSEYKWKNSDAVKRALKMFISGGIIKMQSKSRAIIVNKDLKENDLKDLLLRFNNFYNEHFVILQSTNSNYIIGTP